MIKVLFVCMGNICRSPTAEGAFQALIDQHNLDRVSCDSAGTHGYHVGEAPDPRSIETALARGMDIRKQRSRKVRDEDFFDFDYILAMDNANLRGLMDRQPQGATAKVQLFLDYADAASTREVPDPYYGGPDGFHHVFDLVEMAAAGLLNHLRATHPEAF